MENVYLKNNYAWISNLYQNLLFFFFLHVHRKSRETEIAHPPIHSPNAWLDLGQAKARNSFVSPCGWQGHMSLSHHLLCPRTCLQVEESRLTLGTVIRKAGVPSRVLAVMPNTPPSTVFSECHCLQCYCLLVLFFGGEVGRS